MGKKNIRFGATREWKQVYVILEQRGVCNVTFFSDGRSFLANNIQFDTIRFSSKLKKSKLDTNQREPAYNMTASKAVDSIEHQMISMMKYLNIFLKTK